MLALFVTVLTALFLLAIITVAFLISIYNSLITLKKNISKAWANIDVLLKQRHDELPKLVEVVKGHMKYERDVLERITEARTAFMRAETVPQKAEADNALTAALKNLFAVAENYPELKANRSFLQLQERISQLESHIADRREFYNDSVNTFNIRIHQIPHVAVAGLLGYTEEDLFKTAELDRQDVKLEL
jgi:LemA protein